MSVGVVARRGFERAHEAGEVIDVLKLFGRIGKAVGLGNFGWIGVGDLRRHGWTADRSYFVFL